MAFFGSGMACHFDLQVWREAHWECLCGGVKWCLRSGHHVDLQPMENGPEGRVGIAEHSRSRRRQFRQGWRRACHSALRTRPSASEPATALPASLIPPAAAIVARPSTSTPLSFSHCQWTACPCLPSPESGWARLGALGIGSSRSANDGFLEPSRPAYSTRPPTAKSGQPVSVTSPISRLPCESKSQTRCCFSFPAGKSQCKSHAMQANLYALGAIALWASLASLGVALTHVPPFLLTGIALLIGSLPAWPFVLRDPAQWRIPVRTLALGVYGLFAYHFLLFIALRHAPPVETNLVCYLWPLLIVLLSPWLLPGVVLRAPHLLAALLGFAGAAIAITGGAIAGRQALTGTLAWGYLPALAAAFIWASYSLLTRRVAAFPTTAIGLFALVSGLLSLLCHALLEPAAALQPRDWALLAMRGISAS